MGGIRKMSVDLGDGSMIYTNIYVARIWLLRDEQFDDIKNPNQMNPGSFKYTPTMPNTLLIIRFSLKFSIKIDIEVLLWCMLEISNWRNSQMRLDFFAKYTFSSRQTRFVSAWFSLPSQKSFLLFFGIAFPLKGNDVHEVVRDKSLVRTRIGIWFVFNRSTVYIKGVTSVIFKSEWTKLKRFSLVSVLLSSDLLIYVYEHEKPFQW